MSEEDWRDGRLVIRRPEAKKSLVARCYIEQTPEEDRVSDFLGYVVVEWNQASHQPDLDHGMALTDDLKWAHELARMQQDSAQKRGRRERYTVHAVTAEEIEEGS